MTSWLAASRFFPPTIARYDIATATRAELPLCAAAGTFSLMAGWPCLERLFISLVAGERACGSVVAGQPSRPVGFC